MKKLLLLSLIFIFSACSGSDDDNVTLNQDFVGSWSGISVDNSQPPMTEEIDITFESDGEGYSTFDKILCILKITLLLNFNFK